MTKRHFLTALLSTSLCLIQGSLPDSLLVIYMYLCDNLWSKVCDSVSERDGK